jgi:hypothetical protein|tara:strand:+ start:1056 stop:1526 length:471 start_codon:yes stop_codon:yes gene_type:complete
LFKDKNYKILGSLFCIIALIALLGFIKFFNSVSESLSKFGLITGTDMSMRFGDYLMLFISFGGIAFTLLFITGIIYLLRAIKKKPISKLYFISAISQILSLVIVIIGLVKFLQCIPEAGTQTGFCIVILFPAIILSTIVSIVGLILLIIAIVKKKK